MEEIRFYSIPTSRNELQNIFTMHRDPQSTIRVSLFKNRLYSISYCDINLMT